jgi:hypothetical protein
MSRLPYRNLDIKIVKTKKYDSTICNDKRILYFSLIPKILEGDIE